MKNKKIMYSVFFLLLLTCGLSLGMLLSPSIELHDASKVNDKKKFKF